MVGNELRYKHGISFWEVIVCAIILVLSPVIDTDTGRAAGLPKTVAEIALYQGPDREKILIEGAKKEGQLVFYNSNTWLNNTVAKAFEKKHPFIKVLGWRSDSAALLQRVREEYKARRFLVDVIESSDVHIRVLQGEGLFQEYFTPEGAFYNDEVKEKGKNGLYYLGDRELYFSLGFNTKLVPVAEAPKTWQDLVDPKWKGRMSIVGTSTGVNWVGNALEVMGREFLEKMSRQELKVQNISAAAMSTLIASGEVPLSPTGGYSTLYQAKVQGAPVEWRPIEPVVTNSGLSGITVRAAHPHAAMLFLDYLHSKEGQKIVMQGGLSSPREDMGEIEKKFKKTYMEAKYSLEEYEKKYSEWESLMTKLFVKRR